MKARIVLIVIALVIIGMIGGAAWRILFPSEEKRVKKTLFAIEKAAEERSTERMLLHFADEFTDSDKGADMRMIREGLYQFFMTILELKSEILEIDVEVDGDKATARLRALVLISIRGYADQYVPLFEGAEKGGEFVVKLEKRNGEWIVVAAKRPAFIGLGM